VKTANVTHQLDKLTTVITIESDKHIVIKFENSTSFFAVLYIEFPIYQTMKGRENIAVIRGRGIR
jgi:hypothetical protein